HPACREVLPRQRIPCRLALARAIHVLDGGEDRVPGVHGAAAEGQGVRNEPARPARGGALRGPRERGHPREAGRSLTPAAETKGRTMMARQRYARIPERPRVVHENGEFKQIAQRIEDWVLGISADAPLQVAAVWGDRGSGKTSMLHTVLEQLANKVAERDPSPLVLP